MAKGKLDTEFAIELLDWFKTIKGKAVQLRELAKIIDKYYILRSDVTAIKTGHLIHDYPDYYALRVAKKVQLADVSAATGISVGNLSKIENGERQDGKKRWLRAETKLLLDKYFGLIK